MINASKKYKTELQYELTGSGENMACYAYAEDHNGHIVKGPTITMQMAKDEGWLGRNGSKWKTMPEVMIRYRAASFFGRLNCPDMIMGIYSADEVVELGPDDYHDVDPVQKLQQEVKKKANADPIDIAMDPETGEVLDEKEPDPSSEAAGAPQEPPKESPRKTTPPATRKPEADYNPGF